MRLRNGIVAVLLAVLSAAPARADFMHDLMEAVGLAKEQAAEEAAPMPLIEAEPDPPVEAESVPAEAEEPQSVPETEQEEGG